MFRRAKKAQVKRRDGAPFSPFLPSSAEVSYCGSNGLYRQLDTRVPHPYPYTHLLILCGLTVHRLHGVFGKPISEAAKARALRSAKIRRTLVY